MLICPQCYAENPNRNNFCQKCGTSLTHRDCPECGTSVLLSDATCSNCGAVTGKILWAIIRGTQPTQEAENPIPQEFPKLYGDCIDIGQRYRLFNPDTAKKLNSHWQGMDSPLWIGQVVDCQPLQPSVLKILLAKEGAFLEKVPSLSLEEIEADSVWKHLALPPLALPYFKLQDLTPKIPEIYDAWCEEETEIILIANQADGQPLTELFTQEPLPLLQLVYWFNEMIELWRSLVAVGYGQSLFVEENWRVDEDQNLALQLLYPDAKDSQPSLTNLGKLWQEWLVNTSEPVNLSLEQVVTKLATGEIETIEELSQLLEAIAIEEQSISVIEDFSEEDLPNFEDIDFAPTIAGQEPLSTLPDANVPDADDLPTAVLPMQLIDLADAGYTDRGNQRPHNEDYFGLNTQIQVQHNNQGKTVQAKGIYVVCDGMGGHAAGEVASQLAVSTLQTYFSQHWQDPLPDATLITEGIWLANQTLFDINQQNASSGSGRMGTTLIMALVQGTKVAIAHVGDSRIYRVTRRSGLEQLTVDHEVGQQAIQHGLDPAIAYGRPDAYQLTQALGPHGNNFVQPDIRFLDIEEDTLLLLCSDGISDNNLVEDCWETHLLPLISSSQSIDRGMRKLMEFANENNGHDNLTGILIRLKVRPQVPVNDW